MAEALGLKPRSVQQATGLDEREMEELLKRG
jgi:hypothetical protein